MKLNEKQRQEIDKQIINIECVARHIPTFGMGEAFIEALKMATSRISDVLAGELGDEAQPTVINEMHKPPLGLKPRRLVVEARIKEILEAMSRYVDEGRVVPEYWHDELSDKLAELKHGVMG